MSRVEDLRNRYAEVRAALEDWLPDDVRESLGGWASGEVAMEYFGSEANALDALCLLAAYEKQLPYVLWSQVQAALGDGHSWNEIAAALGVSRQAAQKRFER